MLLDFTRSMLNTQERDTAQERMKAEAACLDILEAIVRKALMARTFSLSHLRPAQMHLSHFSHTVAACWQQNNYINKSLVTEERDS